MSLLWCDYMLLTNMNYDLDVDIEEDPVCFDIYVGRSNRDMPHIHIRVNKENQNFRINICGQNPNMDIPESYYNRMKRVYVMTALEYLNRDKNINKIHFLKLGTEYNNDFYSYFMVPRIYETD